MGHGLWLSLSSSPISPFDQSGIQKTLLLACRDVSFILVQIVCTCSDGFVLLCVSDTS